MGGAFKPACYPRPLTGGPIADARTRT